MVADIRSEVARCLGFWKASGVDIQGYNTRESAEDLEALRRAIGARKVNLWAISYGTHLGLAFLKRHADVVERAVFAGIEGLDETVKLPAQTDAMLNRLATLIDAEPGARAAYPDLVGLMRRVHARLDREPAIVTLTPGEGRAPFQVEVGGFVVRLLAGGMISDPVKAARLPAFYAALDAGHVEVLAAVLGKELDGPAGLNGMPEAMDVASGISAGRLAQVRAQAETSVLGDALNYPMPHLLGVAPELDLGDAFREAVHAETRVLVISGTLDGRTYPEAAQGMLSGFRNGQLLTVLNGGHNIFEADPRVGAAVVGYFRGEEVPARIELEAPRFFIPGG
jgi:pimeloyl-ACP methyl ester carboxylesterase